MSGVFRNCVVELPKAIHPLFVNVPVRSAQGSGKVFEIDLGGNV